MSDRRRRPGNRGALFLLLLGVIFLGAGVLLHLYGSDDREVVAQDVGSLPGTTTTASRPLAEDIPVLSGLDELLLRPGSAPPVTGVAGLNGGFDGSGSGGPPGGPAGSGLPVTRTDAAPGGEAPGGRPPGAVAPVAEAPTDPAVPGSPDPGGSPATALPAPGADPSARAQAADERSVLDDPLPTPVPRRTVPAALPQPPAPLAPAQPGLLGPVYPLPVPTAARPATPVLPAVLELPARAVTAPVDAVGTDPSGGMVVPEEVRTVGWWAPGVLPGGASGSAVIAGHVDSRTQGVGVLSILPQLTEGEPVRIRDASGRTAAFRVAARREYGKYDLPRDVFRRDGAPQLVLITCGGRFDPAARSYESNIVVYAVPDPGATPPPAAPPAPAPTPAP